MILADQTLTVVHRGKVGTDRLGKDVIGETGRASIEGCRLEQAGSTEGAEYVTGRWTAYLPPDTELDSSDQILADGKTFAVDGAPAHQRIPGFPFLDHLLVTLTHVGG